MGAMKDLTYTPLLSAVMVKTELNNFPTYVGLVPGIQRCQTRLHFAIVTVLLLDEQIA